MPFSAVYNFFIELLTPATQVKQEKGLLRALIDAVHGEDNRIGGQALTRLTQDLNEASTATMFVESTLRFGQVTDGSPAARFQVGEEVIEATGRTEATGNMTFTTLTRGVDGTPISTHASGTLVFDLSANTSAIDFMRRGLSVNTAKSVDLDVIGRNLGLHKCEGISEEAWRRFIKAVAYAPKGRLAVVDAALEAYFNNTSDYRIIERLITAPSRVILEVLLPLVSGVATIQGRFVLTGNTPRVTTGLTTVTTPHPIRQIFGVFLSTKASRRGLRQGLTNYYLSHVGSTITLSPSPGAIGTAVLVDYQGYNGTNQINYHYLAYGFGADSWITPHYIPVPTAVQNDADRWAYLSDPSETIRCLLDQVRPPGIEFNIKSKL